jgi:hypothetical protein
VALALAPLPAVAFQFACSAAQRLVWVCPGFEAFPKAEEEQPARQRLAVALALAPLPAVAFQFAYSAVQRLVWVCAGVKEALLEAEEEQPEEHRASPRLWASIAASVLVI